MFCQEILIASQSLIRNVLVGTLLLSVGTLADTPETRSRTVAKPSKNAEAVVEATRPGEAIAAKANENTPRLPNASAIRSVKVTKDFNRGGLVLATIELDGQAQFSYFTLPSPYRLVVDVQNVITDVPDIIQIGMADLKRVRLGKMDDSVRIVFDGARPQPFEIDNDGGIIRIWFGEPKPVATLAATQMTRRQKLALARLSRVTPEVGPTAGPTVTANLTAPTTKIQTPLPSQPKALVTATPVRQTAAVEANPGKVNHPAPITTSAAPLKPIPVYLPTSAKLSSKAFRPRLAASFMARKIAPVNRIMLARRTDAPPPPKAARKKAILVVKTPVPVLVQQPSVMLAKTTPAIPVAVGPAPIAKAEIPEDPQTRGKKGPRVVTATPTPVTNADAGTTATTPTTTIPSKAANDEKAVATNNKPSTAPMPPPSTAPATPAVTAPVSVPRPRETTQAQAQSKSFNPADYARADFVGEPINLDLRSTQSKVIDIRDFLRFITDTYKVNFVLDQSVRDIPITVTLQNVPWNQAMEALLRANRLGVKVEGSILRVMSQETIALEDRLKQEQIKARQEATPLTTEMVRLKYARAATSMGGGGGTGGSSAGASSPSGSGGAASGAGSTAGGSGLDGIITSRLSARGKIQADPRTNTLIITDVPENVDAIKGIIAKLDVPEPQVEIESRIVIANRNFARDLGVQLGAVAVNNNRGSLGSFSTLPATAATTTTGTTNNYPGFNPFGSPTGINGSTQPLDSLRAAGASSVLGLTTGLLGTAQISLLLTAAESKGNVKTISSPRVTAQNNTTANIVNGVQIPVQTESNNTLTVTFVTAALRLEITPQINDSGNVLLKVVAENNSVNTAIATRSAPGINTQRAETTVLVPDGGTTIIGGINIDVESNAQQRTPGVSRIPGLGELFKRRQVSRQTDEILFFITPRIYRPMDVPTVATPNSFPK